MMKVINDVVVLIPSLDPDELLVKYVKGLYNRGLKNIIVVDDGSSDETKCYFEEINSLDGVNVVTHAVNQGKGRALKTGFNYFLNKYKGDNKKVGVVTADSDGQHSVEDTIAVAEKLCETNSLILGTRDFSEKSVPFKSSFGNRCTTFIFKVLYGKWINDTQTGLRGVPYDFMKDCMKLKGERFEYEILMLIEAVSKKIKMVEKRIETIYIDSNRATHFNAIKDSIRIYSVIFSTFIKFMIASILSFVLDIGIFAFITKIVLKSRKVVYTTLIATVIARILSSIFNYNINKNVVFKNDIGNKSVIKYYTLCIVQMLVSWLLVVVVYNKVNLDTTVLKLVVDSLLFIISYQIQNRWIFSKK